MNPINAPQQNKAKQFYDLHKGQNVLVLPNAWDPSSARLFELAGFQAIGTTSAGIAHSLGYAEPEKMSREEMLLSIKRIVDVVSLPVSADIEAGYADTAEGVSDTIQLVITAGAVGANIEDSPGLDGNALLDLKNQVERLQAAREAANSSQLHFVINARTDIYLFNIGEPNTQLNQVIERANHYLAAGADCVFIPGIGDSNIIARLVREIHGPINILANPNVPNTMELQRLGVKRVSTGSGPMRATLALVRQIANELFVEGTYNNFTANSIPYNEVNALFLQGKT